MDIYQYKGLNHGEIRLLKFCSSPKGGLSCEILHKPFNRNTPPFAALSYTWGEEIYPERLLVGEEFLPITTNLKDALEHVQKRMASKCCLKKSSLLWVDAICINQSDKVEKSAQVPLMADLYSQANKVYAWLGMPDNPDHVRAAVSKLKHFYKRYESFEKKSVPMRPLWWPNKYGRANIPKIMHSFDPDDPTIFDVEGSDTHIAWLGIKEMWQKDWWKRAWILQESTVAENDHSKWFGVGPWPIWALTPNFTVIFLCGQYSTHWREIGISIHVADYLQSMPLLNTAFLAGHSECARKVWALRTQRRMPGKPELLDLLQRFRYAECLNPRDKVYSLIGLLPDPVKLHIAPDYSKSAIDVYIDSISHTLKQQSPNLNFLGYAMKLDSPQRALSDEISRVPWPSWIPNWDDPLPLQPLPKMLCIETETEPRAFLLFKNSASAFLARTAVGKVYNASLDFVSDASVSNYHLDVKGVRVDVIVDLWSYETMSWDQRTSKLTEWKSLLGGKYGTEETFDSALARLQVADVQYDNQGYAIARNNSVNNALLGKPTAQLTPKESSAKSAMQIAFGFTKRLRGLCLTKEGYIAVVPRSTRRGDRICVLLGGQVLYVLRDVEGARQGNTFEYIGECYTHGLMDGEVMRWVQGGKAAIEQFTLV